MNIDTSKAEMLIFTGIGVTAGITSVWINFLIFKTGTLTGLSLSYVFVGILFMIIGFIIKNIQR